MSASRTSTPLIRRPAKGDVIECRFGRAVVIEIRDHGRALTVRDQVGRSFDVERAVSGHWTRVEAHPVLFTYADAPALPCLTTVAEIQAEITAGRVAQVWCESCGESVADCTVLALRLDCPPEWCRLDEAVDE